MVEAHSVCDRLGKDSHMWMERFSCDVVFSRMRLVMLAFHETGFVFGGEFIDISNVCFQTTADYLNNLSINVFPIYLFFYVAHN